MNYYNNVEGKRKNKMPTLRLVPHGCSLLPVIELTINKTVRRFLIDTGCEYSAFCPSLVPVIPLNSRETKVTGIGGVVTNYIISTRFNFCGITIRDITIDTTATLPALQVSGIIGQDILRQFTSYEINNRESWIKFNP
jgi:Retroviral aspartyl protease